MGENTQNKKIAIIIMASGYSERFGSNKLLESFLDKPLFTYTVDLVVTAFSICSTPFLGAGLTAYRLWYALWLLLYQIGLFSSNYFCHFVAILFDTSRFLLYNIGI